MSAELKFVDTNVLVYLFDGDSPDKQARDRESMVKEVENIVLSRTYLKIGFGDICAIRQKFNANKIN